jgi:predicted dehydrogenase
MTKKICVIGGGRWGQNHIRTLYQMGNLAAIVVRNPHKLQQLLEQYPVAGFTSVDQAIEAGFDGYTVVTPAETHYQIGKKLLENGCHTLIEKPMALSSSETAELVDIAERNNVN